MYRYISVIFKDPYLKVMVVGVARMGRPATTNEIVASP